MFTNQTPPIIHKPQHNWTKTIQVWKYHIR